MYIFNYSDKCNEQKHVHEVQGSVEIAEPRLEPHNHRFATVSGQARPVEGQGHVHDIAFRTDSFDNHFHEFFGTTGGAVRAGDRHIHYLESVTNAEDGHFHDFRLTTFIEDPLSD